MTGKDESQKTERKKAPEVQDDQDKRLETVRKDPVSWERQRELMRAGVRNPSQSEPKPRNWGEHLDWNRHKFAQWLVIGTLSAILILSVIEYVLPREDQTFAGTIDVFQIIATTALGYVLGRSERKNEGNGSD